MIDVIFVKIVLFTISRVLMCEKKKTPKEEFQL